MEDNQICVSAASDVFCYGLSCFEGLKPAGLQDESGDDPAFRGGPGRENEAGPPR